MARSAVAAVPLPPIPADVHPTDHRPRRSPLLPRVAPVAVPGILMLVLGLTGSGRPALSWDEIATVDVAQRPAARIWELLHHIDGVFGSYYLFMHWWTTTAGISALDLRLPSILAMAAAVALTGELGRRLAGPVTGTLAGILLCLMPNMSRYAAEARPYAFACLVAMTSLLLLHRVLDRPGWPRLLAYGLVTALLGVVHLLALTVLGGHAVVVGVHARRIRSWRPVVRWGVTVAAVLVALTPLIVVGLRQRDDQLSWVPPLTPDVAYAFPAALVGSPQAAWMLIGLVTVAVWRPLPHTRAMLALALVPIALIAVVSLSGANFWVARYLLIVLAPIALVAARGLKRLAADPRGDARVPAVRLAVVCVIFGVAALPGQAAVRGRTVKNGTDLRSTSAVVAQQRQPGDVIVYTPGSRVLRPGTDYYLRDVPGRPIDILLLRTASDAASLRADEYADAAARVSGSPRVWLLVSGRHNDPAATRPDLAPMLGYAYRRTGIWQVKDGTLALFTRTGP
ncbi:hypothetical protein [Actinoplanes sp. NPDC051494]|uniref:hypothetical protein n=1 Tax=Actinoplanes sp. NPDC051494 TaxID=3363907 RepID=UPI00378FCCE1